VAVRAAKNLSHNKHLLASWGAMDSDNFERLLAQARAGGMAPLARLLTEAESAGPKFLLDRPEFFAAPTPVPRIGITGPPGAGKSTLIAGLLRELRAQGQRVAVLAVDPSSPFTRGAILGDRIRYSDHFLDEGVFIRSLGTRGSLGGLSSAAYLMLRVLDQMPFDLVLIETVGVGQTELEIVNVADLVAVVLVPESGDSIQAMKAGLTEIADVFIVNKADRPGADGLVKEIQSVNESPVLKTSALQGDGVRELVADLLRRLPRGEDLLRRRTDGKRLRQEGLALLRGHLEAKAVKELAEVETVGGLQAVLSSTL
jgi:LAO/AO transport system kinase